VTEDPPTNYEGLDAEGLAEFQRRAQLPCVYDAVTPRVYVNTINLDQQSSSSTRRDLDVTEDPHSGYERLDVAGLVEFQRRTQLPRVYDAVKPRDYANTTSSDQLSASRDLDVTEDPPTGYERLDAEGLAEFQRRAQLPRVYTAVEPRVYVNTATSDQQSTSSTCHDLDVTTDSRGGYERLDAEGLAEFRRRTQLPRVYTAVEPRVYVNTTSSDQQSTSSTHHDLDVSGDPPAGYERLDAEGLAEFHRRP